MNLKTKTNTVKQILARVMLVVLLVSSLLTLNSCGQTAYQREYNSHKEFVDEIEKYNSLHNGTVDTFISFDLDSNDEITKRSYWIYTLISSTANSFRKNHGYICDIHNKGLGIKFLYYLKSDYDISDEYAYKIKCSFSIVPFNFTKNDKIEFLQSKCEYYGSGNPSYDYICEESLLEQGKGEEKYNHVYHYSLYVNDTEACCIHISSVEETSKEKLDNIIKMLEDSLVVINTGEFFIWRNKK